MLTFNNSEALVGLPETALATLHDPARHGQDRADNNCLVPEKDSKTQIEPFYKFERRKELDGGAEGRETLL